MPPLLSSPSHNVFVVGIEQSSSLCTYNTVSSRIHTLVPYRSTPIANMSRQPFPAISPATRREQTGRSEIFPNVRVRIDQVVAFHLRIHSPGQLLMSHTAYAVGCNRTREQVVAECRTSRQYFGPRTPSTFITGRTVTRRCECPIRHASSCMHHLATPQYTMKIRSRFAAETGSKRRDGGEWVVATVAYVDAVEHCGRNCISRKNNTHTADPWNK